MPRQTREDAENLIAEAVQRRNNLKVVLIAVGFGILCLSLVTYGFLSTLNVRPKNFPVDSVATEVSSSSDPLITSTTASPSTHLPTSIPNNKTEEIQERHDNNCTDIDFGYLILAVRWPIGACEDVHCIPQIPKQWKIHGLWPNFNNGSWPQFCCDRDKFNVSLVEPLRPRLEKNWMNLLANHDSASLWAHEWDKHGTCSTKYRQIRGEFNYFESALDLFDKLAIASWLEAAKITPGTKTSKDAIKAAIKPTIGKNVSVHCITEHDGQPPNILKGQSVLESLHFCYTKDTLAPMDCPDHDSCPNSFLYPSK